MGPTRRARRREPVGADSPVDPLRLVQLVPHHPHQQLATFLGLTVPDLLPHENTSVRVLDLTVELDSKPVLEHEVHVGPEPITRKQVLTDGFVTQVAQDKGGSRTLRLIRPKGLIPQSPTEHARPA